jgi:hypothetical protein
MLYSRARHGRAAYHRGGWPGVVPQVPPRLLTLADRLHVRVWSSARGVSLGERLWADRALRGTLMATSHLLLAFSLTLVGPVWLMLVAPLLFGVPHIFSDIRHLLIDPPHRLSRGLIPMLMVTFGLMTVVRVVSMLGGPSMLWLELILGALSVGLAVAWARGRPWLRLTLVVALVLLTVPAMLWPRQAALIIGHAHNFVAVGIWWMWSGSRSRVRWVFVGSVVLVNALILGGAVDVFILPYAWDHTAGGLSFSRMVDTLAPDLPIWLAPRVVLSFALMQAVHYSMWLWCIPQSNGSRRTQAPLAPSSRWASWRKQLGLIGVFAVVIGVFALPTAGAFVPAGARWFYLSLVLFHGWLELAIIAHLLVIGGAVHGARASA